MIEPDSRAVVMKISDDQMDDCARCSVSITSDTDKRWIVANVYEDCCSALTCAHDPKRRWNRLEHWHEDCYDLAAQPYGPPQVPKKKPRKQQSEDWENE